MAKVCVQCDKKIGFFSSAIDGIYCSYECRDASKRDIANNQKRAEEKKLADEQQAREAAAKAAQDAERARAEAVQKSTCPKCGATWSHAESGGAHKGECSTCHFTAEFSAIETCPNCKSHSLVVQADGARCPRCKFRRS